MWDEYSGTYIAGPSRLKIYDESYDIFDEMFEKRMEAACCREEREKYSDEAQYIVHWKILLKGTPDKILERLKLTPYQITNNIHRTYLFTDKIKPLMKQETTVNINGIDFPSKVLVEVDYLNKLPSQVQEDFIEKGLVKKYQWGELVISNGEKISLKIQVKDDVAFIDLNEDNDFEVDNCTAPDYDNSEEEATFSDDEQYLLAMKVIEMFTFSRKICVTYQYTPDEPEKWESCN